MKTKSYIVASGMCLTWLISGCTNNVITEEFDLKSGTTVDKVISVDAKQRLAFIRTTDKGLSSICSEPSPDALSSIVSGITLGGEKAGTAINLALSNSESAASIGLRTQSIQLLRDGMYRICEAYHSGKLKDTQVEALLKRYQDTMIAILAIESLTGAVQASQVTLTGKSRADIGKDLGELSKLLTDSLTEQLNAKNDLVDKEAVATKAKEEQTKVSTALADEKKKVVKDLGQGLDDSSTHEKIKEVCDKDETTKAKCKAYDEKYAELETANKALTESEAAKKTSSDKLKVLDELVKSHKQNIAALNTAGSTSAETEATIAAATQRDYINQHTVEKIASAVTTIVDKSLLRNDVVDRCVAIASEILELSIAAREANKGDQQQLVSAFADNAKQLNDASDKLKCSAILDAYAVRFKK